MSAGLELKGGKAMLAKLARIEAKFPDRTEGALRIEAEYIRTDSVQNYVPKNLSALAGAIHVQPPTRNGNDIEVKIVAGGPSAPYALSVHEHPSEHSPPSWQGKGVEDILSVRGRKPWSLDEGQRGPKYLERPLNKRVKGMAERIAAKLGAGL